MAYPTTIDSFTDQVDGEVILANDVNELQTAIESLEAKVGADSSAVTTSHDYKLGEVTGSDKAVGKTATQTLTNKTLTSPVLTSPTVTLGSDAEGDTYYRNSSGAFVRLARGTDNYIYKMNGNVPNWEAESANVDASATVKGVVEIATAAQITAGTATGETGAVLAISPDQLASSTPVFNGSGITNITTSYASANQSVSGITTATNTDTTLTVGFTAKIIQVSFRMIGQNNAGTNMYADGVATFDGTTLKHVHYLTSNSTSETYVPSISSTAPKAGDETGGGNGVSITMSISAVTSTQVTVRFASLISGTPTGASATFSVTAWK